MRKVLTFACAACIVLAIVINHADAASDSLTDLQLVVVNVVPSGKITVRMANGSHHKPLRVWTEANSWGALRWRVVIIRKGRRLTIFEDPDGVGFTKNTPQFDNLAAGGHIDRQLDLNGEYWSKLGSGAVHFQSGDQVILVYDVPPENEAKEMHVWYGVAAVTTTVQ